MSIKSSLKSNLFLRSFIEKRKWHKYSAAVNKCSDMTFIEKHYAKVYGGVKLNWQSPLLFTEKLQWLKLFYRDDLIPICSNKVTAKEYLMEQGLGDLLVPTLGIYDRTQDIALSDLQEPFIIKGSHGSGWNFVVKDKNKVKWNQLLRVCDTWLEQNIYVYGREWNYEHQPRHIIVEPLLKDEAPIDYKAMCFNGIPRAFQVNHNIEGVHYVDLYDSDWNLIPDMEIGIFPHSNTVLEKPEDFDRMKQIASKLAEPFPFVRVDFYNFDKKLYFGEMTFFPGSGFWHIDPESRNEEFGNWLELPAPNYNLELLK